MATLVKDGGMTTLLQLPSNESAQVLHTNERGKLNLLRDIGWKMIMELLTASGGYKTTSSSSRRGSGNN